MSERGRGESTMLSNAQDIQSSRPFRFKEKCDSHKTDIDGDISGRNDHRKRHHSHRHHHHKHKRRKVSHENTDFHVHDHATSALPPDVAFRESLFDALGDDEGADFWHGVYGQPIHNYSRTYVDADNGELETMDDEQYAQYVRRKMWEKSAEGLEAAREAKKRERKEEDTRRRQEQTQKDEHGAKPQANDYLVFDLEIDASLKRGQSRKEKKKWQMIWQDYTQKWRELQELYEARKESSADNSKQVFLRNKIAWPVESGIRSDISHDEVEKFLQRVSNVMQNDEHDYSQSMTSILKAERVKWHPDKIQQRYGFLHIDTGTMEGVTAVFQALDRMWAHLRGRNS